jgi:uncharacterized protein (TIGR03437 family)
MKYLALCLLLPILSGATPSRLLLNQDRRHEALAAVGRLRINSTCTAFLIQPRAASPVYALTNGHCVLGASGNEVATNVAVPPSAAFTTHYFVDTPSRRRNIPVKAIPYATLKGLDLAVIELDTTWAALDARPLRLSETPAQPGDPVFTVGAPVNGVPAEEAWLRRSDCSVDAIAQLAEGPWKFHDALRLACGAVYGGASGSPVFNARSGDVTAIINTGTQGQIYSSGDIPCYINSPCELPGRMFLDTAYALPLTGVANCFNTAGRFDLTAANCPLDPGNQPTLSGAPFTSAPPGTNWNVTVSGVPEFRYKTGPEGETDCRIDSGYSAPQSTPQIRQSIPAIDGRYILCVLGPNQQPRHATFTHTAIDSKPPALNPLWSVRADDNVYSVQFFFNVPDLSDYRYKFGPDAATDCDNTDGYQIYRRVPIRVPFDKNSLIRFCLLGGDRAGNLTRPTHILLGENHPLPSGVVNSAGFEQGPLSPGAWASLFLASPLTGSRPLLSLIDSAGTSFSLPTLYSLDHQMNFPIPRNAAVGPAHLRVASPFPSTILLDIQPVSPGIFVTPTRAAWGFYRTPSMSAIFAGCGRSNSCFQSPIPVPATVDLIANGMGLTDTRAVTIWLAGQRLPGRSLEGAAFDIPANFPYRGFVPVQIEIDGIRSNIAYLHLKDEGI